MIVHVEMMAFIRRPEDLPRVFSKEISEGVTIESFMDMLGFQKSEIRAMQFFLERNDEKQRAMRREVLEDKDNLFITLPIGGG